MICFFVSNILICEIFLRLLSLSLCLSFLFVLVERRRLRAEDGDVGEELQV